jgi:DNA (cytosine-5)-methyltransferase 1
LKKYRAVSLFCGIGGMDLGIQGGFKFLGKNYPKTGTEVVFASDFDPKAADIYSLNFGHAPLVQDIRDLDPSIIPDHDVLMGGFPCQSFSVAATNPPRLGYTDLRGQLFFEMVRILKNKKPSSFIAENVKGLLSANSRQAFPLVIEEFEKAGYFVKWKVLNASNFGVPQKRERVFIVGFRDRSSFESFEFPDPQPKKKSTLGQVLESEVADEFFFSERAVQGMKTTKNSTLMNKGRSQNIDSPCNTVGAHLSLIHI